MLLALVASGVAVAATSEVAGTAVGITTVVPQILLPIQVTGIDEHNKVDAKQVLKLIQTRPKDYKLDGPLKLRFTHASCGTEENLFTRVELLVELLG